MDDFFMNKWIYGCLSKYSDLSEPIPHSTHRKNKRINLSAYHFIPATLHSIWIGFPPYQINKLMQTWITSLVTMYPLLNTQVWFLFPSRLGHCRLYKRQQKTHYSSCSRKLGDSETIGPTLYQRLDKNCPLQSEQLPFTLHRSPTTTTRTPVCWH